MGLAFSTCVRWGRLNCWDSQVDWLTRWPFVLPPHSYPGKFRLGQREGDPYSMLSFRAQADVNIDMASEVAWGIAILVSWAGLGGLLGGYYGQALEVAYCPSHPVSYNLVAWLPLNTKELEKCVPRKKGKMNVVGTAILSAAVLKKGSLPPRHLRDAWILLK